MADRLHFKFSKTAIFRILSVNTYESWAPNTVFVIYDHVYDIIRRQPIFDSNGLHFAFGFSPTNISWYPSRDNGIEVVFDLYNNTGSPGYARNFLYCLQFPWMYYCGYCTAEIFFLLVCSHIFWLPALYALKIFWGASLRADRMTLMPSSWRLKSTLWTPPL